MGKILECIFAYVCKSNYAGECLPADQIYTITKNSSEKDISILTEAIQSIGRVELTKIDARNGVSLYSKNAEPSFDLMSYTYLPAKNGQYNAFSCASLRRSLRDKNIRGSKELTLIIAFDETKDDFYVVDMLKHNYYSKYKDIMLDESASIELANEDLVCEIQPDELDELTLDNFSSRPLSISDISSLGKKSLKVAAEYVHAILLSVKENRPLYVVYNPEEYDEFLEYTKVVLKMFPTAVANNLSFVTALGKTSRVNVNICGVPTSDAEYISSLRSDGNVIKITGLDVDYLGGTKGTFASFLENASFDAFGDWLDSLDRYRDSIHTVTDMDIVAALYTNIIGKDFDVNNPKQALRDVSSCIKVIADKFDIISRIDNELESQISGVNSQLKHVCGAFEEYSTYDIEEYLIEPILALYDKCLIKSEKESGSILSWLKYVLFGLPGQSKELERKHYNLLSACHKKTKQALDINYIRFVNVIEINWTELKTFFDNYLNEPNYAEASAEISLSFLDIFLNDLSNVKRSRVILRDYFVLQFLQKNPEKFGEIVKIIFSHANERLYEELTYIFDIAIKTNADKKDLIKNRIEFLCNYIKDAGLLNKAIEYVKDRYTKQSSDDEVLDGVFKGLLKDYFVISNKDSFADIYNAFIKAQKLLGENPRTSLSRFVFESYANSVLIPNYESALKRIRFEDWDDTVGEKYRFFVSELKSPAIRGLIPQKLVLAIEDVLDKYDTYKTQTKRENEILRSRIDFVAREFLLLKNKTIYKMLIKYIGMDKLMSDLQVANIRGTAYKHPEFLKFAESEVVNFLRDKDSKNQMAFCDEVRMERKRIARDLGVDGKDILGGVIGSAIFAIIMAVIASIVGTVIYTNIAGSYFKSIYVIFVGVTLLVSFILCWTNYKYRRLRNMFVMSTWQSLLFLLATMGIFTLVQSLLALLAL